MPSSDRGHEFFGSLESLRGVAALSVALSHALWLNPVHLAGFVRNSYLMVDLFFVLSGFVICHAYGDRLTNRVELRDFFLLRLGRLYPLHLTVLGLFVAIEVALYVGQERFGVPAAATAFTRNTGSALVSNLLLTHSLGLHRYFTFNGPSWSISTEFYTYALFALAVLAMGPGLKRWRLPVFLTISASSLAVLMLVGRTDLNITYDFGWFRCAVGFFLGAACCLVLTRSGISGNQAVLAAAPYVAAASLAGTGWYLESKSAGPSDFLLLPLAAILVISLAASPDSAIDRWLQVPALAYLGKVSYSVYMVHYLLSRIFGIVLTAGLQFDSITTEAGYRLILTDPLTGTIALVFYVSAVLVCSGLTFTWIEDRYRRKTKAFVGNLRLRSDATAAVRQKYATSAVEPVQIRCQVGMALAASTSDRGAGAS